MDGIRNVTHKYWFYCYMLLTIFLGCASIYSMTTPAFTRSLALRDQFNNTCGGKGPLRQYPYLYIPNLQQLGRGVCVDKCPKSTYSEINAYQITEEFLTYQTSVFSNLCVPSLRNLFELLNTYLRIGALQNAFNNDFYPYAANILAGTAVSLLVILLTLQILKFVNNRIAYVVIIVYYLYAAYYGSIRLSKVVVHIAFLFMSYRLEQQVLLNYTKYLRISIENIMFVFSTFVISTLSTILILSSLIFSVITLFSLNALLLESDEILWLIGIFSSLFHFVWTCGCINQFAIFIPCQVKSRSMLQLPNPLRQAFKEVALYRIGSVCKYGLVNALTILILVSIVPVSESQDFSYQLFSLIRLLSFLFMGLYLPTKLNLNRFSHMFAFIFNTSAIFYLANIFFERIIDGLVTILLKYFNIVFNIDLVHYTYQYIQRQVYTVLITTIIISLFVIGAEKQKLQ